MYAHLPQPNHRDKEPAENKKKDITTKNKTTQHTNETTHKLPRDQPAEPNSALIPQPSTHIRGLDGELRSGEEAMNRWREHFDNLLNGDAGSGEEVTADGNEVQNEEGGIEVEEVERAVRKLKSRKAGVVCGIQVEIVKAGEYTMVRWLKDVLI